MTLVATLERSQQERTAQAQAEYRALLEQAQNLDQYRDRLDRNDSKDAAPMTSLMTSLGLSARDVVGDFDALQSHRAASERLLSPEKRQATDSEMETALAGVHSEAREAIASLFSMVPAHNAAKTFGDVFAVLLSSTPHASRQAAVELARQNEWVQRAHVAKARHGAALDADRRARAETERLEREHPRVLGSVS